MANTGIIQNGKHYSANVTNGCVGSCGRQPQFCFSVFPNNEKRRLNATNFQLKELEQVHICGEVQTNNDAQNTGFLTASGLVSQNRLVQCVFPYTSCQKAQMFSSFDIQQKSVSDDLPSFWSGMRPQSLRDFNKLDSSEAARERVSCSSLFRRLPPGTSRPRSIIASRSRSRPIFTKIGMANKLCQIQLNSPDITSISRNSLESSHQSKVSALSQDSRGLLYGKKSSKIQKGQSARNAKHHRACQLCKFCHPQRTLKSQSPSQTLSESASKRCTNSLCNPQVSSQRIRVVGCQYSKELSDTLPSSIQLSGHRRLESSLGRSAKQSKNIGSMEPRGREFTFKLSRNVSNLVRSQRSCSEPCLFISNDTKRQQNRGLIFEERRGHEICKPNENDTQNFVSIRSLRNPHGNPLSTWPLQRRSRSLVSARGSTGMAFATKDHEHHFCQIRRAGNRPLCICCSPCRPSLWDARPDRSTCLSLRRVQPSMGLSPSLGISASIFNASSVTTPKPSQGAVLGGRSTLDQGFLETRPQSSSPRATVHNQQPGRSSDGQNDRPTTFTKVRHDSRNVDMWGWAESLVDWSDNQKLFLQNGWRNSSIKTYQPAWKKWCNWCKINRVCIAKPTGSELARFLIDLHQVHGLAYNTILVYKSAISTLCDPDANIRLSCHLLVRQALKAISLASVNERLKKAPIWDVDILADWLHHNLPDQNSLFECSLRAAILLLLCSGRRVHDLTLLAIDQDHCSIAENSITFWPKYGSKTDTQSNRQSGWRLFSNSNSQGLDPLFWIKRVIQLSQDRRSICKKDNLFLTVCGPPKEASRCNIAGWIKKILIKADIKSSPGSIRPAVASKHWIQNCELDDILARGNWRSENTFLKYYCREIRTCEPSRNSVKHLFNPVNE